MGSSQSQAGSVKREKTAAEKAESAGKIINGVGNFIPGIPGALVKGAGGVIEGVSSLFTGDDIKVVNKPIQEAVTYIQPSNLLNNSATTNNNNNNNTFEAIKPLEKGKKDPRRKDMINPFASPEGQKILQKSQEKNNKMREHYGIPQNEVMKPSQYREMEQRYDREQNRNMKGKPNPNRRGKPRGPRERIQERGMRKGPQSTQNITNGGSSAAVYLE